MKLLPPRRVNNRSVSMVPPTTAMTINSERNPGSVDMQ